MYFMSSVVVVFSFQLFPNVGFVDRILVLIIPVPNLIIFFGLNMHRFL